MDMGPQPNRPDFTVNGLQDPDAGNNEYMDDIFADIADEQKLLQKIEHLKPFYMDCYINLLGVDNSLDFTKFDKY